MRVLVAEDDPGLREVLIQGLEEAGYFVDAVEAGDDAIEQLHFYEYDVAIVDWRMPHASGLDVVSWARRHSHPAAMLMLTARDTLPDRIEGLDAGADDYLVKPFSFSELLARIRALLRRPVLQSANKLASGDIAMDLGARSVTRGTETIVLTPREFAVLEYLLRHPGQALSRAQTVGVLIDVNAT